MCPGCEELADKQVHTDAFDAGFAPLSAVRADNLARTQDGNKALYAVQGHRGTRVVEPLKTLHINVSVQLWPDAH